MSRSKFAITDSLKIQGKGRRTRAMEVASANETKPKRRTTKLPEPQIEHIIAGKRPDWSKLDLSKVKVLAPAIIGITAFEALEQARRERLIIVPNFVHDHVLIERGGILPKLNPTPELVPAYPSWTGTLVIYEQADKPFGNQVAFSWVEDGETHSINVKIPAIFVGKENCALVIEHPNFKVVKTDSSYQIVPTREDKFWFMELFPKEDGCYATWEMFRIPYGDKLGLKQAYHGEIRRELKRRNGAYVGLISRQYTNVNPLKDFEVFQSHLYMGNPPSNKLGVLAITIDEYKKILSDINV